MNGTPWTREQLELLRKLYPDTPTRDVAKACGHSLTSCYGYASQLGLSKSAAFLASPASGRLEHHVYRGEKTRFPKGHVPANSIGRGRMRETQFKKGARTQTWVPIGTEVERKDGYIWVKVSDGVRPARRNWKSKHQAIYEDAHGPIAPAHMVCFKDGDNQNFDLVNLELVSQRERARRNSVHNLPRELVQVIQLRGAVRRQINKRRSPTPARRGRPPKQRPSA
jgi:hypothetical protein